MKNGFGVFYLSVFGLLALTHFLVWRRLDPKGRKKWHPRLTFLTMVLLGPFFVLPSILWRNWLFLGLTLAFFALMVFVTRQTRVCEACGATVQPQQLVVAAEFCPKCGTRLTPTRLWGEV